MQPPCVARVTHHQDDRRYREERIRLQRAIFAVDAIVSNLWCGGHRRRLLRLALGGRCIGSFTLLFLGFLLLLCEVALSFGECVIGLRHAGSFMKQQDRYENGLPEGKPLIIRWRGPASGPLCTL